MKLTLEINMDNAAFGEDYDNPEWQPEAARILRKVADRIESGSDGGGIVDINGNKVGEWGIFD